MNTLRFGHLLNTSVLYTLVYSLYYFLVLVFHLVLVFPYLEM